MFNDPTAKELLRRQRISNTTKGKMPSNFYDMQKKAWEKNRGRVGILSPNYGRKVLAETRKKQSLAKLGKPSWNKGGKAPWAKDNKFSLGVVPWNKGIKFLKMSGDKHWNWQGGKTLVPGYEVFIENTRRSRKFGNGGTHTHEEWEILKKTWNYMCLCCKRCEPEIKLTEDHILPLSKGGRNDIENIQPLCMSCNRIKNAKYINYIKLLTCFN